MNHLKKILCLGLAGLFGLSLASCTKQTGMAEPKDIPTNLSTPEKRERFSEILNINIVLLQLFFRRRQL